MSFQSFFAAFILGGLLVMAVPAQAAMQMEDKNIAVLRTIDKVSARTHTFDIPVDKTVKFGTSLFIKVRSCRKSLPIEKTESAAFLQIWERKPQEDKPLWVFSGWMFASRPALSAMDHPVYDVWVIDCKNDAAEVKTHEFSSEKTPEAAPVGAAPATGDEQNTEEPKTEETPKSEESSDVEADDAEERKTGVTPEDLQQIQQTDPTEESPDDAGAAPNTGD